jgi:hypothetical protein
LKKALAAACALIVVLVIAIAVGVWDKTRSSDSGFRSRLPPVEFVYLDGPRILDFLAELEGGEVGEVHRITKEINSVKAGGSAQGFEVGASSQHETSAESTITRTEASGLGLLLDNLRENQEQGVAYHPIEINADTDLTKKRWRRKIREGMLVRFVTHDMLSPGYIHPYVVVRQSATLAALFPQEAGDPESAERAEEQKEKAESFARQVGPDPRLTFAVSPRGQQGGGRPLRVLLPMRYRGLTSERGLLEKGKDQYTGGRLVVFGKVVRIFRKETTVPCGPEGKERCAKSGRPEYTDFATREIWRNPLEQASKYLIEQVSHNCKTRRTDAELNKHPERDGLIEGRDCFLAKLRRQTQLYAPGIVILPIAIFK